MKTIKLITLIIFTIISFSGIAQSKGETGSSDYYDFYNADETAIYGMKRYFKDGIDYLFITDAFKLCSSISKSDTWKFDDDLESYIEANYNSIIEGANKYLNYGGLSNYTHTCFFFEKGNGISSNYVEAKRGRINAMSEFNKDHDRVRIIKINRLDFDFNLPCD